MSSDGPSNLREGLRAQRAAWPARSRLLWFGLRPACTLAALVGCALMVADGVGVLPAVGAGLLILVVRPVRRSWFDCVTAGIVLLGSPLVAAMVVVRMLAGIVAIRLAGGTREQGLLVVSSGRRALTGIGWPDQVERELRQTLENQEVEFEVLEKAFERWISAWATADAKTIATTTFDLLRGLFLWQWSVPVPPSLEIRLLRLAVSEKVIERACRLAAVVLAMVVVWQLGLTHPAHVFGLHVPAIVAVVPPSAAAWWSARSNRTPPITGPVITITLSVVLYGWATLPLLGIGAVVGLPAGLVRSALQDRLLGRPVGVPRLPLLTGTPSARDRWVAAGLAWSANRTWVARRLWSELVEDERQSASVRAAAAAAVAQLDLAAGSLQRAVERAETALELVHNNTRVRGQVYATAGRVLLAAGDTDKARVLLDDAAKSRRQRRDPLVSTARAQVLALDSDVDSALRLLNRSSGGLLRGGNLDQLIDSEIVVAALLARQTPSRYWKGGCAN